MKPEEIEKLRKLRKALFPNEISSISPIITQITKKDLGDDQPQIQKHKQKLKPQVKKDTRKVLFEKYEISYQKLQTVLKEFEQKKAGLTFLQKRQLQGIIETYKGQAESALKNYQRYSQTIAKNLPMRNKNPDFLRPGIASGTGSISTTDQQTDGKNNFIETAKKHFADNIKFYPHSGKIRRNGYWTTYDPGAEDPGKQRNDEDKD